MKFLNFFKSTLGITIIILAVIAGIVIYLNWDTIRAWFAAAGGRYAPPPTDGSQRVSSAVNAELSAIQASTDLTANEKNILTQLFTKLSNLGASDINTLSQSQRSIAMGYINDAISQLPNGRLNSSTARVSSSTFRPSCRAECGDLGCKSSWGSWIFGFCICWNCADAG